MCAPVKKVLRGSGLGYSQRLLSIELQAMSDPRLDMEYVNSILPPGVLSISLII